MNKFIENLYFRSAFLLIFAAGLCTAAFGQKSAPAGGGTPTHSPNEIIIELNPANQNDLPAISAQYNLVLREQVGVPPTYRMEITDGQTPEQKLAAIRSDARVLTIEFNRTVYEVEHAGLPWT